MGGKTKQDIGSYFWRNGERIAVEREAEYITMIVKDEIELDSVRLLPGVSEAKRVKKGHSRFRSIRSGVIQ